MPRPFRFFLGAGEIMSAPELRELARRAESIGYTGLVIPDHLLEQLAPLPALVVVAEATERLRVGTYVLNNDLRHPAVLAQDLATIDLLTGGRLDVGIGAGWNLPEYEAIGLPFDEGPTRVSRLEEAIQVLKRLFSGERFDFEGRFYTLRGMEGRPVPAQRPHPPFLVGGGGRRLLGIAAREAEMIGLAGRRVGGRFDVRSCLAPATDEKLEWIRAAAGERFARLQIGTYSSLAPVTVTDGALAEATRLGQPLEVSAEEFLASPHVFIGTPAALVEKCVEMRERWSISDVTVFEAEEFAPVVERLASR